MNCASKYVNKKYVLQLRVFETMRIGQILTMMKGGCICVCLSVKILEN